MPRSLWSGSIIFGLVNAPVRIYSAIEEHKLHFHLLHTKDDSPIGYEKICKKEDKPVPDDEIVKAFEYAEGKFVYMEDEDFEAARGGLQDDRDHGLRALQRDRSDLLRQDLLRRPCGRRRARLLAARAGDEDSGLAAVAKFVMRDRQHLGVLRVREGVITLEQLHFADEIRPVKEIKPRSRKVDKQELAMASQLIDSFTGSWEPAKYKDTYRDELLAVDRGQTEGQGGPCRAPSSTRRQRRPT